MSGCDTWSLDAIICPQTEQTFLYDNKLTFFYVKVVILAQQHNIVSTKHALGFEHQTATRRQYNPMNTFISGITSRVVLTDVHIQSLLCFFHPK